MINKNKEFTILDSKLNTATFFKVPSISLNKNYNIKVLDCKGYKQVYIFDKVKSHSINGLEKNNNKKELDSDNLILKSNYINNVSNEKKVRFDNVQRSKLSLQRIAKTNEKDWKTFITLTFKDNITDLSKAYNIFRNFIIVVSRHKKGLKYLCVPEFQKNGRVHYHLVTNIDLELDKDLLYTQELENGELAYHLKNWSKSIDENNMPTGKGFDCIETIKDKDGNDTKKLCGYIAKYMTKAYIEDCFFNKNRYYISQNLDLPITNYIDLDCPGDVAYFNSILSNSNLIYQSEYNDTFGNEISFLEFKTND